MDDKKLQLIDVKKTLKNLPIENNTDLTDKRWREARTFRENCLIEYIKFLETGKKEHISISSYIPEEKKVEHFK